MPLKVNWMAHTVPERNGCQIDHATSNKKIAGSSKMSNLLSTVSIKRTSGSFSYKLTIDYEVDCIVLIYS